MQPRSVDLEDVESVTADITHLSVIDSIQHFQVTLPLPHLALLTSFMGQMTAKEHCIQLW